MTLIWSFYLEHKCFELLIDHVLEFHKELAAHSTGNLQESFAKVLFIQKTASFHCKIKAVNEVSLLKWNLREKLLQFEFPAFFIQVEEPELSPKKPELSTKKAGIVP